MFLPRPRGWRVGGQFDDFDGGLSALSGIYFLSCFPSFCISFLSACVHVLLTSLRRPLSLTSTHRRALQQEHLLSSSVQTTWASHYVSRKIAEVSNPAARTGLFHRENSEGLSASRYIPAVIRSSIRHVGCVGGVSTSATSDGHASGHSRGFSKGSTRRDRISMTAAEKEAVSFVSPGFGADHDGPTPSAEDSHLPVPVAASRSRQFQMLVCRLCQNHRPKPCPQR